MLINRFFNFPNWAIHNAEELTVEKFLIRLDSLRVYLNDEYAGGIGGIVTKEVESLTRTHIIWTYEIPKINWSAGPNKSRKKNMIGLHHHFPQIQVLIEIRTKYEILMACLIGRPFRFIMVDQFNGEIMHSIDWL